MNTTDEPSRLTEPETPALSPWANIVFPPGDAEIERINALEQSAAPINRTALAIRNLITRFELCHFKAERHLARIIQAIATLRLDLDPATIGHSHPKCGEQAWRADRTGRSRPGQEFIWALQSWLQNAPPLTFDARPLPHARIDQVNRSLGERNLQKTQLVSALLNRLWLKPDRPALPPELAGFWEPIERTDICHDSFPKNLEIMIESIGRLEPPSEFPGCGSFGDSRRLAALECLRTLCLWLRGEPSPLDVEIQGRSTVQIWLAACLAKTLKEQADFSETITFR